MKATPQDRERIEKICNDPDVRYYTADAGHKQMDAKPWLAAPNMVYLADGGCFLMRWVGPCRYDIHTNILPAYRGDIATRSAAEFIRWYFIETDAEELLSMVPATAEHRHVAFFARKMGLRRRFTREAVWPWQGAVRAMDFYSLTLDEWVSGGACQKEGQRFHEILGGTNHEDDPIHDSYVGAAWSMARSGNATKAVGLYNRWARWAGYKTVAIVSRDPLKIDIQSAVITLDGDTFTKEASHA